TRLKSAAVRRRRARGKVCGCGAAAARAPMIIPVEGAQLRTQALAALGAPACQDRAAVLRGHTGPKSMRACAAHLARLISTFHDDFKALKTERKMGRQGTQRFTACQYKYRLSTL